MIDIKIVNFNAFLEFAEDMTTKYKFYRIIDGKLQAFMVGRDGLIIHSELGTPNQKVILEITSKGFIETELNKGELIALGLE